MERQRYLFKLYYIGSKKFYGSQRQTEFLTVESCLLNALLEKEYISGVKNSGFEMASRTDKLVSARGACFSCILEKRPVLMGINSVLPKEIGLWALTQVPLEFSSRFNALYRHYRYIVPQPLSFFQKEVSIDLNLIDNACKVLKGEHNFKNFSKIENQDVKTRRFLNECKMGIKNDYIIFDFKSKAFLRQQIRRVVKKLLELGLGDISYEQFLSLFHETNYISYQPADPRGLILWEISFNKDVKFEEDILSKERMINVFSKKEQDFKFKYNLFKILQENDVS